MPESPDFDRIARAMCEAWTNYTNKQEALAEALCTAWNARGAVDLAKVEHELSTMMGATAAGPYCKNLDRALRGLDG